MHVRTGPPTTYEGPPGPGNKTLLVMSPVPTFTLVGKHPSSPSQHGSTPPTRDSSSGPQPEDTGTLSPLRVDRGGVSTNQSPPPCCPSTTAQESVPSLPLAQLDPPRPAGLASLGEGRVFDCSRPRKRLRVAPECHSEGRSSARHGGIVRCNAGRILVDLRGIFVPRT